MVDPSVVPAFLAVVALFLLPPGPDMAYVVATGLHGGRAAAVRAVLGVGTGMALYAAAVVLGVARLVHSHPSLLDGVRVVGAAYLLWLAWTSVRAARRTNGIGAEVVTGRWYRRGLVVSLTNPKLALFFLAVLPQFMGRADDAAMQLAMLGAVNIAAEVLLYGGLGLLAGQVHSWSRGSGRAGPAVTYVAAAVYAGLGCFVLGQVAV